MSENQSTEIKRYCIMCGKLIKGCFQFEFCLEHQDSLGLYANFQKGNSEEVGKANYKIDLFSSKNTKDIEKSRQIKEQQVIEEQKQSEIKKNQLVKKEKMKGLGKFT